MPDVLVIARPYKKTSRALLDPPFLIVEVLSPEDRVKDTMRRFNDYEAFGFRHIVQLDPEDRTTFIFSGGALGFEVPGRGFLPFSSRELLARLDEELA